MAVDSIENIPELIRDGASKTNPTFGTFIHEGSQRWATCAVGAAAYSLVTKTGAISDLENAVDAIADGPLTELLKVYNVVDMPEAPKRDDESVFLGALSSFPHDSLYTWIVYLNDVLQLDRELIADLLESWIAAGKE